jgi:hypothetical protein
MRAFMQNVAQSWLVWQLTRSALLLGIVGFFDSIPRLFLGAIGGAIADRVDRRKLLIVTQTLGMLQATVYAQNRAANSHFSPVPAS